MDFEFFYDLAEWVNEQWKCSYTAKEVAVNATYWISKLAKGVCL